MGIEERLKYWKNEPDESPYRRIYDEHTMAFNDFLSKHYSNEKYFNWSRWNKWFIWINKAFDNDEMEEQRLKGGYYRNDTQPIDYLNALNNLSLDIKLPEDVTKVISFLIVDGFFNHYCISPNEWTKLKNFSDPNSENDKMDIESLSANDMSLNYLRECLIHLPWWDITRGDPQGK